MKGIRIFLTITTALLISSAGCGEKAPPKSRLPAEDSIQAGEQPDSAKQSARVAERRQTSPIAPPAAKPRNRRLWMIGTGGGPDRVVQMVPVGDRLLIARQGVIYALNAQTGEEIWRFPRGGPGFRHSKGTFSSVAPPIVAVLRNRVVTRRTREKHNAGGGILAISLRDGMELDQFRPDLMHPRSSLPWTAPLEARIVFYSTDRKWEDVELLVFDLLKWREIARFEVPGFRTPVDVVGDQVFGFLKGKNLPTRLAFRVDLGKAVISTATTEMKVNRSTRSRANGATVFQLDGDGKIQSRAIFSRQSRVADHRHLSAVINEEGLFIVDSKTNTLRLVVAFPAEIDFMRQARAVAVVIDTKRIYFSWPHGLVAYANHAVDPDRPDSSDEADPAYGILRCRNALRTGNWEGALNAVRLLGMQIRFRMSLREEAAMLLSSLSRSPAAQLYPLKWEAIKFSSGWIAGELFLADYEREVTTVPKYFDRWKNTRQEAAEHLLLISTPRSLGILHALLDKPSGKGIPSHLLLEAAYRLGKRERPRPSRDDLFRRTIKVSPNSSTGSDLLNVPYYVSNVRDRFRINISVPQGPKYFEGGTPHEQKPIKIIRPTDPVTGQEKF